MSRRLRRLIALFTIAVLVCLSGCVRLKADYDILNDEEVRVSVDSGYLNTPVEESTLGISVPKPDSGMLCGAQLPFDSQSMTVEEYTEEGENGYTGCRVSGVIPVKKLERNDGVRVNLDDGVWKFEMAIQSAPGETTDPETLSEFRISVTFPGKVLSYSGSPEVNGTTVTWTDPRGLVASEGLVATARNSIAVPWLLVALGALVVVGIGLVVALVLNNSRRKKARMPPQQGGPWEGDPYHHHYPPQGPQYPPQRPQYPPQGPPPRPYGQPQPFPPQGPPQQQFPGHPYPGQQYPGQPYPGQQYPGQPYPGQQYPGQQYPPQGPPPQGPRS